MIFTALLSPWISPQQSRFALHIVVSLEIAPFLAFEILMGSNRFSPQKNVKQRSFPRLDTDLPGNVIPVKYVCDHPSFSSEVERSDAEVSSHSSQCGIHGAERVSVNSLAFISAYLC